MAREKKITLFSRNLVKIEKITGVDFEKRRESPRVISVNVSTTYEDNAPVAGKYEKGGWVTPMQCIEYMNIDLTDCHKPDKIDLDWHEYFELLTSNRLNKWAE